MTDANRPGNSSAGIPKVDMNAVWAKLEATTVPGTHQLGLDPLLNFNATITKPENTLGLFFVASEPLSFEQSELVGSDQILLECTTEGGGTLIRLTLQEESSREMFRTLCSDLVPRVVAHESESAAATTFIRRFNAWQRFLKRQGEGLSKTRQQGLYGELVTLRDVLLPALGISAGLASWIGPYDEPQDFQSNSVGIEVKTISHSEPQQLRIDGERQLDDFGLDALVVAHHRVFRHHESGQTLPGIIDEIRAKIRADEGPLDDFDDRLFAYGYGDIPRDQYLLAGYSMKDTSYYRVQVGFPRLTEVDLRPGVGALTYSIDVSACERFLISAEEVSAWFTTPPPAVDLSSAAESVVVDHTDSG